MKKSGLYITTVAILAGTMILATPLVSWAQPQEAVVEEVENADAESDVIEEESSPVIQAGTEESIEDIKAAMTSARDTAEAMLAEAEAIALAAVAEAEQKEARENLVDYALQFVGGRYRTGGNDPHTGADCSGFVKYVMQHGAGIYMNRSSRAQATQGRVVSAEEMQKGDLIFYGNGSGINHVAMYIGDGRVVHASTHKTGIKISTWNYRSPVKIVSMFG